jgi:hypothetical protein
MKFSLRDLFWLMLAAALAVTWLHERSRHADTQAALRAEQEASYVEVYAGHKRTQLKRGQKMEVEALPDGGVSYKFTPP